MPKRKANATKKESATASHQAQMKLEVGQDKDEFVARVCRREYSRDGVSSHMLYRTQRSVPSDNECADVFPTNKDVTKRGRGTRGNVGNGGMRRQRKMPNALPE